jgi:hypothetical protein
MVQLVVVAAAMLGLATALSPCLTGLRAAALSSTEVSARCQVASDR